MDHTAMAAAAARAGARQWWGSGPRPLNLPGAVPNAQSTTIAAVSRERAVPPHGPVVLEPTPAQIARGQSILWVDETPCGSASQLHKLALAAGWEARLSRSRYLSEPSNRGTESRRGRQLEHETVALRLARGVIRAWFVWDFDVERARWSPAEGQTAVLQPNGMLFGGRTVSVTELKAVISWTDEKGGEP